VEAVPPTAAELLRGVREHRVARRILDRLADALDEPDRDGDLPEPHERERREREELHDVAEDRDAPVRAGLVGRVPGDETEGVADEFARARGDADGGRALEPRICRN
jgi:hypothetical protein